MYTHHYEPLDEKYLSYYRDTPVRLLETGLDCGMARGVGSSAQTWREYLGHKAELHYIEIDEQYGKKWESTIGKSVNVTIYYGSQENILFLRQLMSNMQPFEIIIDDGGHTMSQQKTSFMTLLPLVRSGGLYVIEDLQTRYIATLGGAYLNPSSTIGMIKDFVDEFQAAVSKKTILIATRASSFEVGDGICFFTRK